MTPTIAADKTKAKILFLGLYAATVAILIIIFLAIWKEGPAIPVVKTIEVAAPVKDESSISETVTLLQAGRQSVEDAWMNGTATEAALREEARLTTTLDSIDKASASLKDEQKQLALKKLTAGFRASLQKTKAVVNRYATRPNDTVYVNKGNDEMVQNLKAMLVEKEQKLTALQNQSATQLADKEQTIASLQNQLKNTATGKDKNLLSLQAQMQNTQTQLQKTITEKDNKLATLQSAMQATVSERDKKIAVLQNGLTDKDRTIAALQNQVKTIAASKQTTVPVPQTTSTDGAAEWRQKHAQLKASYDNLVSKNNSLLNSYKTLAQDNKRLTSQLQIRRATAGRG